jgi:hypothetical protein
MILSGPTVDYIEHVHSRYPGVNIVPAEPADEDKRAQVPAESVLPQPKTALSGGERERGDT